MKKKEVQEVILQMPWNTWEKRELQVHRYQDTTWCGMFVEKQEGLCARAKWESGKW